MLKGGKTMQLLLQLNAYFMQSTFAQIDALDVSCSGNHNALHKAKSRANVSIDDTHQQVTIVSL